MAEDEIWAFLSASPPHTAKVATVRSDGRPHVAPVWYDVEDRSIVFNTSLETVKGRNLTRTGWAALCVDDERPPFAFVVAEGPVELSDEPEALRRWATRIGGRYMGAHRAAEFGARNGVPPELVVRLRPERFSAAVDLAD
jgi:hypothetical protein